MLTLTLLRHAKSSWDEPDLADHERPLAKRGTIDAPRIGRWLAKWCEENSCPPDFILCSDAVRTRGTLALILPELTCRPGGAKRSTPPAIEYSAALYLAAPDTILTQLASVPSNARHVVVIGHNPGLHRLALALTGAGDADAIAALARKFPTSGIAIFSCDVANSAALGPGCGRLAAFMTPKRL